ncbi:MAG: complex I NDUFA9 subunit family protein [Arenicellales bacterium]|nr:complex I NDUFA9 subunit family protein [Arenicellales bacterium]
MTAQKTVVVIGGSGFVGRHLLARLVNAGLQVTALARSSAAESGLRKIAGVRVVRVKLESDEALSVCLAGQAVVINLVGILHESREIDFDAVHVAFPCRLMHLCQAVGVTQYLHMSALNADAAKGPSRYLKSRGEGEDAVHHACGGVMVTSFRPSIIFGSGDNFFGVFDRLLDWMPVFPVVCPQTRFAPVCIDDVVEAFYQVLERGADFNGQRLNLCGPQIYTFKELVQFVARVTGRRRLVLGLPDWLSRLQALVMERLPGKLFTRDNYRSMQIDSVCAGNNFSVLGISPKALEDVMTPLLARPR